MAFVPQTIVNPALQMFVQGAQQWTVPFQTAAGTPLNVSVWNALFMDILTNVSGQDWSMANVNLLTGSTVVYSSPNTTFTMTTAQATSNGLANIPEGNYTYTIYGKPTSGDDFEQVAAGQCTMGYLGGYNQ